MVVYLSLCVFVLFFTWLEQRGSLRGGSAVAFVLIFLFLAMRYEYGNDYASYHEEYTALSGFNDSGFYYRNNELAWLYLNATFKAAFGRAGFPVMVAAISLFITFAAHRFIARHIPREHLLFATTLFILHSGNILVLSTALRQAVGVGFFLLAVEHLLERHYVRYAALVGIASLFHTSVLLLLLLPVLNIVPWRVHVPYVLLYVLVCGLSLSAIGDVYEQIAGFLYAADSDYAVYAAEQNRAGFGVGLLFNIFTALLIPLTVRDNAEGWKDTIAKFGLVEVTLLLGAVAVAMVSRMMLYTFPVMIIGYVMVVDTLRKQPVLRLGFQALLVSFYAYNNYQFWVSEVYRPYFFEYRSLLDSPFLASILS